MVEVKKKKKRKTRGKKRKERRFFPSQSENSKTMTYVGFAGALALGAGVYAQWIREPELEYAKYIVAAGAVVFGGALWFGDAGATPVRVGDAGIAIEKGSELTRLAWCDIDRIFVEGKDLAVKGDGLRLQIALSGHRHTVAWILEEARRRLPEIVDVPDSVTTKLPKPKEGDGELLVIEDSQVAGRRCAASDKTISFERDARFCPNCGQVYHKEHVPKSCSTCDEPVGSRAARA